MQYIAENSIPVEGISFAVFSSMDISAFVYYTCSNQIKFTHFVLCDMQYIAEISIPVEGVCFGRGQSQLNDFREKDMIWRNKTKKEKKRKRKKSWSDLRV